MIVMQEETREKIKHNIKSNKRSTNEMKNKQVNEALNLALCSTRAARAWASVLPAVGDFSCNLLLVR